MPAELSALPPLPDRTHTSDRLAGLAHLLADDALAPSVCGVEATESAFRLHVHPLDGPDPVLALLGFDAPAGWDALAVTVSGRASRTAVPSPTAPDTAVAPVGSHERVVVGLVVDRSGGTRSVLRRDDAAPVLLEDHERGEAQGFLVDACRRAMALPTAPPDRSPVVLLTTIWLDQVLATMVGNPSARPSADELAVLHPAVPTSAPRTAAAGAALVSLGIDTAGRWSWSAIRRAFADQPAAAEAFELRSHVARWMDDGMFSRWLLSGIPELSDLRAGVAELAPSRTAAWVDEVVEAWGLPR